MTTQATWKDPYIESVVILYGKYLDGKLAFERMLDMVAMLGRLSRQERAKWESLAAEAARTAKGGA